MLSGHHGYDQCPAFPPLSVFYPGGSALATIPGPNRQRWPVAPTWRSCPAKLEGVAKTQKQPQQIPSNAPLGAK